MDLKKAFLAQLDREAASSRKAVERVPEGRNDWKPHEKSMELGRLAALVATMPGWMALMIEHDELNLDDPASEKFRTKPMATKAQLIVALEERYQGAHCAQSNHRRESAEVVAFCNGRQSIVRAPPARDAY